MSSDLVELHDRPIPPFRRHLAWAAVHLAAMAGAYVAWRAGWWPVTVVLWGAIAWLDHAALTRLHEAAHGTLVRRPWLNEAAGVLIGTASLTPLGVYRYVHARHHAHLGGPRDPEFRPYNDPSASRAKRIAYAWAELVFGWILTPALYSIRTARSWRDVPARARPRIVQEWIVLALAWAAILAGVHALGWWEGFVVCHLVPAWLAGTMQTLRKFTEHLGMHGEGIVAMTRTVSYEGALGRAASSSQLHVEHHGTHHRHARIPWHVLPEATEIVYGDEREGRVFRTHGKALRDMLPHLLDPKLGAQWTRSDPPASVG